MEKEIKSEMNNIEKPIGEIYPEFKVAWKNFLSKSPKGIAELAKYGWYVNNDFAPGFILGLLEGLSKGNVKKVDNVLSDYYENEIENIQAIIMRNNPKRKAILTEAFDNHYNERYFSSITLMLTQIDGICNERFNENFFKSSNGKPLLSDKLLNNNVLYKQIFGHLFSENTAINKRTDKLKGFPVKLNRHAILHGMDYDYNTKINSLKIISMFGFINDLVHFDLSSSKPNS